MYLDFYGFSELPFELTPNPRFLFLAPPYTEALSNIRYGIQARKPLTLLLGDAGTGKTTLIRSALTSLQGHDACFCHISNPSLTRPEFIQVLADGFNLSDEARSSKATLLAELSQVLTKRRAEGRTTALVVDEAQTLPDHLLEEIRLLGNIETDAEKLLPIILAGQPELSVRLEHPALRQIKQRISLRCALRPLDVHETAAYVSKRIRTAGGDAAQVFTREAVTAIYEHSGGIPRLISVLCDNALVNGFALDRKPVTRSVVVDVAKDFNLSPMTSAVPAALEPQQRVPAVVEDERRTGTAPSRRIFHFF